MKITLSIPRSVPSVEPKLLVRFVIQRCREVSEPPAVLVALALAAVAGDHKFYNRLMELVLSSDSAEQILRISRDLFVPALGQIGDRQTLDDPQDSEENPFPDEQNCNQVLSCALSEGKRILAEQDFDFIRVFEFLTRTGLSCYSFRLAQFEDVCEFFRDDPENLVQRGIEIHRSRHDEYHEPELVSRCRTQLIRAETIIQRPAQQRIDKEKSNVRTISSTDDDRVCSRK